MVVAVVVVVAAVAVVVVAVAVGEAAVVVQGPSGVPLYPLLPASVKWQLVE